MEKEIKVVSWNLGNAMYPAKYSYEKAQDAIKIKNIFPVTKAEAIENVFGQISVLKDINADVMLLQEISKLHMQNHFINPFKRFTLKFPEFKSYYNSTVNIFNFINQGKATFTKEISQSYSLLIPYKLKGYLNNLLFANSDFIVTRVLDGDNELIIINIHLTPFERSKAERELQLQYVFNFALSEYEKGNYVLIGGDWNVDMPLKNKFLNYMSIGSTISDDLISLFHDNKWCLAFSQNPTLRDLKEPYTERSLMSGIDGFLLSPNLQLLDIDTINDFRFSDHCPVTLRMKYK